MKFEDTGPSARDSCVFVVLVARIAKMGCGIIRTYLMFATFVPLRLRPSSSLDGSGKATHCDTAIRIRIAVLINTIILPYCCTYCDAGAGHDIW